MKCVNCDTEYQQEHCPVCDTRYLPPVPPWYYKNWFITLCLLLVFPVGLVLVWKKPGWTVWLRTALSVAAGVFFISLVLSVQQSTIPVSRLTLQLEQSSQSFDINLTVKTSVTGSPERAGLYGLQYYSEDESVVRFENGRILTVGEGITEVYVSNRDGTVFSNRIRMEIVDREAAWQALELQRQQLARQIERQIDSIGDISLDSGEIIGEIRDSYESAELYVQQLVGNLNLLEQAEQQYELLRQENQEANNENLQQTVYYTRTGSRYHYANPCGSGTYYPCSLEEAEEMGLTPCSKCVP